MPFTQPPAAGVQENSVLFSAFECVRQDLSGRSKALTPSQKKRLISTLERLEPAANAAIVSAAGGNAGSVPSFSSVLAQLSHA